MGGLWPVSESGSQRRMHYVRFDVKCDKDLSIQLAMARIRRPWGRTAFGRQSTFSPGILNVLLISVHNLNARSNSFCFLYALSWNSTRCVFFPIRIKICRTSLSTGPQQSSEGIEKNRTSSITFLNLLICSWDRRICCVWVSGLLPLLIFVTTVPEPSAETSKSNEQHLCDGQSRL